VWAGVKIRALQDGWIASNFKARNNSRVQKFKVDPVVTRRASESVRPWRGRKQR
jgi:hypothetical protein